MAEPSQNSQTNDSKPTKKTAKLTAGQALEILQQSILECQKAGIEIQVLGKFYNAGVQSAGILLANVEIVNGNLVQITGNPQKPQG